jgi:hypothetical protein
VGGILEHAGIAGFLSNLPNVYEKADEETAEWAEFLEALRKQNGGTAFTTAEIVSALEDDFDLVATLPEDLSADWAKRNTNGGSFVRRLGKAFSAREGRRHGEMEARIERAGEARNAVKWRVLINIPARLLQFMPAEPGPIAESAAEEVEELQEMANRRRLPIIAA